MQVSEIKVGDVVSLKGKYFETAKFALVVEIQKSEFFGDGGWVSMIYVVMNENGQLHNISEACIEKVYSINKSHQKLDL